MINLVTDYLDIISKKFFNKVAFSDKNREMTFGEVYNEANAIAMQFIKENIFKRPVAIFLDKSVECITAFMGVAYSGNFYSPIDVNMPLVRINKILEILEPEVIITDQNHLSYLKENIKNKNFKVYIYEELINNKIDIDKIDRVKKQIIDTDILYVLFTSGSTGIPKGVIISHRSVIDYTEWVTETFKIDENHIFGNQAPFYFDNSVLDIYQTIKNGAMMYIIPREKFIFPIKLIEFLNEKKINIIFWVPSVLCLIANFKLFDKIIPVFLKKIIFAGEVMPNKQLNIWRKNLPNVMFANLYGPTEITVDATYYIVNRNFNDIELLPIGKPCKNTDILVLNNKDELVKAGEVGELCVRGSSLALGYYNNLEKTKEVFVQNPLNKAYPEIIYRTGDLVKYNEYGELIYISRKDFQIKHMGYRIELGEIEVAISSIEGIEQNCCLYDEKKAKIVMIYVGNVDEKILMKKLEDLLPKYMIPNKKIKIDKMPLNLNGKIDRVKLKELLG